MKYNRRALLVFLLLAFMYSYYYQDPQANGNSRLDLSFAIVQQGRLSIDSYYASPETKTIDRAFINGHYYTDKAIGSSLLAAIAYAPIYLAQKLTGHPHHMLIVKYLLTFLVISLPSAFAGSLVYLLCETITRSWLRSLLATLAVCLGTMILPFSAIFFGHQLAGAFLFCSFFLIYNFRIKPNLRSKPFYLALIGFLLGMAFLTEYTTMLLIVPLCVYMIYLLWDKFSWRWLRSAILPSALGALIPAMILMAYNSLVFGNPFTIGYEHLGNQYQAAMSQGFFGISFPRPIALFYLTFHPADGLFWQSPVLLLSVVGLFYLWRNKNFRFETIVIAIGMVGFLLVNAGYYMWWGGYSFGPRHLIPMLLFLAIPLAVLPKKLIPVTIILAIISFGQMFIPLAGSMLAPDSYFVQNPQLPFFGYSSIYSFSWKQLLLGNFAYNLGAQLLGLKNWLIVVPNILAIILVTGIFVVMDRHQAKKVTSSIR